MANPPEMKIPLGKQVHCVDGHSWMFLGYLPNAVSTELSFIDLGTINLPMPHFYRAVHVETLMEKFLELRKLSTDPKDHVFPNPCPDCGKQMRSEGKGVECPDIGCGYSSCY